MAYDQLLARKNEKVPERLPDPHQLPAVWGAVLLKVPARKPLPVAVQRTLLMGIVLLPETRSPRASTVKVTVLPGEVWALAITNRGFSVAGIDGVVSGSALGKLTADGVMVSCAEAAKGALMSTTTLVLKAAAGVPSPKRIKVIRSPDRLGLHLRRGTKFADLTSIGWRSLTPIFQKPYNQVRVAMNYLPKKGIRP